MGEILALEQQRLAGNTRESVRETIAEVQRCRMTPLAEATPGITGCGGMFERDGNQFDFRSFDEEVQFRIRRAGTNSDDD